MLAHEKKNAETVMKLVVCQANLSNCEKCPQRNDCICQNKSFISDIIDLIKWKDAEIESRKWTNRRLFTTEKERRRELWKKAVRTTAEAIKKKSIIVIGTPTERNILGFEFIIDDADFTDIINDLLKEKKRRNT